MNTLLSLQTEIYKNAVEHGLWDGNQSFGDFIAWCHDELSEAWEEYKADHPLLWNNTDGKPEGVAAELADCIICILSWAGYMHIDMGQVIQEKHMYNRTRPYKHKVSDD